MQFADNQWRFDSPGEVPASALDAFYDLIDAIAQQHERRKVVLEAFGTRFATVGKWNYWGSTDTKFAEQDLRKAMGLAAGNAPIFIETYLSVCEGLRQAYPSLVMPDVGRINRLLAEHGAGFQIDGEALIATHAHHTIAVPPAPASLGAQVRAMIDEALAASEAALAEGKARQAVQDVLWLLETFATAFKGSSMPGAGAGDTTIQAKYFNKIIDELRRAGQGSHETQILGWMMTLHGWLSSPTGGGIRHGIDVAAGVHVQLNQARLYCNLIRAYLGFLMSEYERLVDGPGGSPPAPRWR